MFKSFRSRDAKFCVSTLIMLLFLTGCGKSLPTLDNLDLYQWEKDKNACGSYRKDNIEKLLAQKEKLLALKEMQIVNLLGRPDRNELYKRNQKFFYYYLKPAPECSTYNVDDNARLAIRFNAMGLAKEIMVE
jgi:hypothetical protein